LTCTVGKGEKHSVGIVAGCQIRYCNGLIESWGFETMDIGETRTHRLWRILANVVQVIVISVMFLLIVGIILLFVFIPLFC